jgi:nitrite reductase (NO-forming)
MRPSSDAAPRRCPRTGRSRLAALDPGALRPSDMLVAFFACGTAALVLAAPAAGAGALAGLDDARWLALHLAFLGGVSQLVLGAAQFFACAFLATDPPSRRHVRAELVAWNAGVLAIAVGVPAEVPALTAAGGTLILAGLAVFAHALRAMRRRSLQRAPWATRWYLAAAAFLSAGAALGPLMAAGVAWPRGSLLGAHLALNFGGWFGAAIVGTLHTFYPSLTGTRAAWPRLQPATFVLWCGGVTTLAAGCAFGALVAAIAGWALLLAAGGLLCATLLASAWRATQHSQPALIVGTAQLLLPSALVAGLAVTASEGAAAAALTGDGRLVVAVPAVAGWIGLTVLGSLLHLLGLMARVRGRLRPTAPSSRPRLGQVLVALLAVLAVDAVVTGALLELEALTAAGAAALAAIYALLGIRVLTTAVRAVRAAPIGI